VGDINGGSIISTLLGSIAALSTEFMRITISTIYIVERLSRLSMHDSNSLSLVGIYLVYRRWITIFIVQ